MKKRKHSLLWNFLKDTRHNLHISRAIVLVTSSFDTSRIQIREVRGQPAHILVFLAFYCTVIMSRIKNFFVGYKIIYERLGRRRRTYTRPPFTAAFILSFEHVTHPEISSLGIRRTMCNKYLFVVAVYEKI